MPLIAWAVASYAAGLFCGFSEPARTSALAVAGAISLPAIVLAWRGQVAALACALLFATGVFVAGDAARRDAQCAAQATRTHVWQAARDRRPCDALASPPRGPSMLERWRERTGTTIDTLFAGDAPLVRALLIADERSIPADVRDRFAAAGLVHVLSISGLHVAVIAAAIVLCFEALRLGRTRARWAALGVTALYVASIGAPPPALRSAAMLAALTAGRTLQRPVSPWATLALGAGWPLADPRVVNDLGWQLSVSGFAALVAAGIWVKRNLDPELRGWRRALANDLAVSTLATAVTAPLVAWAFGRVSLVAPLTNLVASPVIGVLQPTLFLALLVAPIAPLARFVAAAAHPLLAALGAAADLGASVPGGALAVAPSLAVSAALGVASLALVVAAARRSWHQPMAVGLLATGIALWWPFTPTGNGFAELHVIDVGQGDAIAFRTPRGRWILVDAGRTWLRGDAGRTTVVPYLRRYGGDLAMFVLTHPHADHVGGAATVLRALSPGDLRDAAFAGGSESYRSALGEAARLGVKWARVHPGDSAVVDAVVVRFLAPDSIWTASLKDPNLASTVASIRYGETRFLLTGDAEEPEERWLLAHESAALRADVLKVGHHGSATSTSAPFLQAIGPRIAVVSVGAGNSYGHPSQEVMRSLLDAGALVMRTDQLGDIVVRTDGRSLAARVGRGDWRTVPRHGQ